MSWSILVSWEMEQVVMWLKWDISLVGRSSQLKLVSFRSGTGWILIRISFVIQQMRRTGNDEETKRITMDLDVVLKSHDCPYIVQCLGCFITEADVWICMELMSTCFDKLQKRTQKPISESILRHVTEAVRDPIVVLSLFHDSDSYFRLWKHYCI